MQIICKSNLPHKAPGSAPLVGIVYVSVTVPQKPVRGAHQPNSTDTAAQKRPHHRLIERRQEPWNAPHVTVKACMFAHTCLVCASNWTYAAHATTGTSCETAKQAASPKPTEAPMLWAAVATAGPLPTGKRSARIQVHSTSYFC